LNRRGCYWRLVSYRDLEESTAGFGCHISGNSHQIHASDECLGGVPAFSRRPLSVQFWWFPAALVLVVAGLIFFNGVALLSPPLFTIWATILPWVASLGYFGFILGIVLGIVPVGAFVLLLGFRVLAALIMLPTAIVSLLIGRASSQAS